MKMLVVYVLSIVIMLLWYRFEIISQKPPGMISGWQRSQNGQIEYSDRLPEDVRISL